ncbi:hypothetical protein CUC15_17385 [Oceanobacillus zhaokaii]|uniref:Motility protein n=2 Tax=Oceanobacillus zhaokaii TaxID=2052660 RepID=A0A345PKS0_9BACI|nr:hypothetical protein CUC15_17385 [Oceanobacillus zhaokaii]
MDLVEFKIILYRYILLCLYLLFYDILFVDIRKAGFPMDVAALSVVMAQNQVRMDAGFSLMDKVMNMSEQQSIQLNDMLGQSVTHASHPSLGSQLDLKI